MPGGQFRVHFVLFAVMLVAACGTLSADLVTTVREDGTFTQTITIHATGGMADIIPIAYDIPTLESEGWEVELTTSGDGEDAMSNLTISGTFTFEQFQDKVGRQLIEPLNTAKITVIEEPTHFEYRAALGQDATSGTRDTTSGGLGYDRSDLELAESLVITWTLTLPGEIVDTNADTFEGNTATWTIDLLELEDTTGLYAVSRVSKGGSCTAPGQ
ncbi:MAG: hypothetical protein O2854_08200 [Chloroflexi bacterium]|nr:hypothetical protein [Chloroflexota bacterium]